MNFAPFNVLEFDGAFPQLTIASWLPTFTQPGRLTIYADGTTLASIQLVKVIPGIPDPWRATTARSGPAPKKGSVIREPARIVSSPPTFAYQAPPATPDNTGFRLRSVPDPWRATSIPWSGPGSPPIYVPPVPPTSPLNWQPTTVQPSRKIIYAAGTDLVRPLGELIFTDKWQATTVQPSRSILRASGTSAVDRLLEIIFADRWQPTTVQPSRAITYAKGTDSVQFQELTTVDKWASGFKDPIRAILRAGGTDSVGSMMVLFDLLVQLSQSVVSVTTGTALNSTAFGRMHVCSGTSANYVVTLPSPTGNAGKFIGFMMDPGLTKLVTVTQNASEKIDGANTRVMWAGESAGLYTDGTNWFKFYGKSIPMKCQIYQNSGSSSFSNGVVAEVTTNTTVGFDNTGLMGNSGVGEITILRTAPYIFTSTSTTSSFGSNGTCQLYIYRNGSPFASQSLYYVSTPNNAVVTSSAIINATGGSEAYGIGILQISGGTVNTNTFNTAAFNNVTMIEIVSW